MQVKNLPLYEILSEKELSEKELAKIKGGFPSRRTFWESLVNGVANRFGDSKSDSIPDTRCRGLKNCSTIYIPYPG